MSWAAHRKTTRTENIAYCLLGLFDVNMPLLYGEREHAFTRLQREIIQHTSDETIFAWESLGLNSRKNRLLASSPDDFAHSGDIVRSFVYPYYLRDPYVMTNKGLRFEVCRFRNQINDTLTGEKRHSEGWNYAVPLCCAREDEVKRSTIVLYFDICDRWVNGARVPKYVERQISKESDIIIRPCEGVIVRGTKYVERGMFRGLGTIDIPLEEGEIVRETLYAQLTYSPGWERRAWMAERRVDASVEDLSERDGRCRGSL